MEQIIGLYNEILDDIEKALNIGSSDLHRQRLSTGNLCIDLVLGGGLVPGMTTFAGAEQSAKSTTAMHVLGSAVKYKIPVIKYKDPEGSVDPDYTANILKVDSLTSVFGKRNDKGWEILPKARYSSDNSLDSAFDDLSKTLHRLPDKLYRTDRNQWFLVFKSGDKKTNNFSKVLGKPDSKLSQKGELWFPTDNPYPQMLVVMDSYPLFLPDSIDEKEAATNAMANQAREYAKHLPRVVGLLRRKSVIILGINQIREKPGVMFGPSEYEPCGNALKFNTSARCWINGRAVPQEWRHDGKVSAFSEELSVEGKGTDQYQYKHIKNKKNKNGTPFLECWQRVWVKDRKGRGRGFDPVFDTAQFLLATGLAKRGKKNAILFLKQDTLPYSGKELSWMDFKTLIVAEEFRNKSVIEAADKIRKQHKIDPKFKLRNYCFKIMGDGSAAALRVNRESDRGKDVEDLEA